ncbi:hypothetical protein N0V84_004276 [Fusarium piperis]|uniref:CBM-cenC domain-containing protein n=1 Tax=Fusarium piperis TaxID=1435070 RepID=A0A9W8WG27_9HYPO|nr:hypothetical protein N0V84_004276 [Fusarium piperis]
MARSSLFVVATLAFGILGANAGPCRPSTTVTSVVETSSTAVAETSSTTLVESSSTIVVESSSTTLVETSTSLAESSSTTLAQTSTTSEAPSCDTTQVLVNPSFDDNDGAPWSGIGNVRSDQEPHTGSHNLRFLFTGGGVQRYTFSQTLTDLNGPYRLSYYYRLVGWAGWDGSQGFSCSIVPTVGSRQLPSSGPSPDGPYQWTQENQVWANTSPSGHVDEATVSFSVRCNGEFNELTLAIDDVTFTEIKCEPLQT